MTDPPPQPEPAGWLSSVFAGPVRLNRSCLLRCEPPMLEPGPGPRSRLCEQVWLDHALFDLRPHGKLFATVEEAYQGLSLRSGAAVYPGACGEQLLLRDVDFQRLAALSLPARLSMADCLLELRALHQGYAAAFFPVLELRLLEAGLTEPGAPVFLLPA